MNIAFENPRSLAILLATYNGAKYLSEQIDSILAQSCEDWHLFIHDDGSTDSTKEILDSYIIEYPDRITIVDGPPSGGAKYNFFYLLNLVQSSYYMFCDQDDVWDSDKIDVTLRLMHDMEHRFVQEEPLLVFTDLRVTTENLQVCADSMSSFQNLDFERTSPKELMIENVISGCTVLINSSLADLVRNLPVSEAIIMHDWWIGLTAAVFGHIDYVPRATISYRQHDENSIGARKFNAHYVVDKVMHLTKASQALAATRCQARLFADRYRLDSSSIVSGYGTLQTAGKLERIRFYRKNNLSKNGFIRTVGFYICG